MIGTADNGAVEIRSERPDDVEAILEVNRQAFAQEQEGRIVDALRTNGAVVLSLVATIDGAIVGHIMFSPLRAAQVTGVALGPMAVLPACQRRGIGSKLVQRGLVQLREEACPFVALIGHAEFYPRFGFRPAADLGMTCEWDVPAEAFMVNVLDPAVTDRLAGRVMFRPEFSTVE